MLAAAYGWSGCTEEARRLLSELLERASRGKYVSSITVLAIQVSLGDVDAIRDALRACVVDDAAAVTVQMLAGPALDAMRGDVEIDRLLDVIYEGARPPA